MAGKTYDMKTRVSVTGDKEYKQSLQDINRNLTLLKTSMNASQAAFKGQEDSMEALTDKKEKLKALYDAQAEKCDLIAAKLEKELGALKSQQTKQQEKANEEESRAQREMEQFRSEYPDVELTEELVDKVRLGKIISRLKF